jgi:ATP-dependent DNA helicase RecQ
MTSTQVLQKYFGYPAFRSYQQEAVEAAMTGQDALVVMPTGGGKSICYQVPALLKEGLTVVISPLIALMKDQVDALKANGIPAAFLNSGLSQAEQVAVMKQLQQGHLKLLYLAPERLSAREFSFMHELKLLNVQFFAVDEAHCISHWGPDFRPDYLVLDMLKQHFPQVPVMALTASADALTRKDIMHKLRLQDPKVYVASFNRPNLAWLVRPKKNARSALLQYLEGKKNDAGIVYCLSRNAVEELAELLKSYGYQAGFYHAGLNATERNRMQEAFSKDEIQVMVATIAFGMGIDKSNVRYVVHMDLPKNLESYYQETGRAGRDGLPSEAILYYSAGDVFKLRNMISKDAGQEQREIMLRKLQQMAAFAEARQCRRQMLLAYFGEAHPDSCGNCDYCLSDIRRYDATIDAQKVLSAVARLNSSYGVGMVIDFLRGSQASKITPAMRALKTYGVGKDKSTEEWQYIIRQLLNQNILELSQGSYPTLQLNALSKEVLSGQRKLELELFTQPQSQPVPEALPDYDDGILLHLKEWRKQMAHTEGVPAYIVLSDATLLELARYRPFDTDALFNIGGFGQFKVDKYGDAVIAAITAYCQEHQLLSLMHEKVSKRPKTNKVDTNLDSPTAAISFRMFQSGMSLSEIAEARSLTEGTIINHLYPYIARGEFKIEDFVALDKVARIKGVLAVHGIQQGMKVLKDALEEDITYNDIRMVLAAVGAGKNS